MQLCNTPFHNDDCIYIAMNNQSKAVPLHEQGFRSKGVSSRNPIALRLKPEERAALEELAKRESRSLSSMARLIFLRGMTTK